MDFTPRPISWGTADTTKLKELMQKLETPEIAHLKRLVAQGQLPKGTNKVLLLDSRFNPLRG